MARKAKKIPGHSYSDRIRARIWISGQDEAYLGVGKITLLELIQEFGSISQAAKAMDMSYKRAWSLVDEMNRMTDRPLVEKEAGGKGGGGARVTAKGEEAIRLYRGLESRLAAFLQHESEQIDF